MPGSRRSKRGAIRTTGKITGRPLTAPSPGKGPRRHSVAIWRKGKARGGPYRRALTPIPVALSFPWGEQTFWGDSQVYLWFRGIWGNDAVKSALMALEQWALEKLDAGAAFDDIFRKVVEGNDS